MTNPPFQDFLCNVYYMRSVGEPLVIYWLYVSYTFAARQLQRRFEGKFWRHVTDCIQNAGAF